MTDNSNDVYVGKFSLPVKTLWICITLQIFFLSVSFSRNDTLYFRHFSIQQGLSHNDVTSIIQDSLGFMWYGTRAGLNKFDGYNFVVYRHDPKNKNSLASDDISCMSVEKSGIVWIGTIGKGVNRLDPYTGIFTSYQHKADNLTSISEDIVTCILADKTLGVIWIGTYSQGLEMLRVTEAKFHHLRNDKNNPNSLSNNSIRCVTKDNSGKLWIGTDGGGVNVFDFRKGTFTYFRHDEKNKNSICSDFIRDIYIDTVRRSVWIATSNGLSMLNQVTGEIKTFRHNDQDEYSLCSNDLSSVYQDKAGKVWVGTKNNGLNVYYPSSGKFFLYSYETGEQNALNSNNINTISQGRSGMFWAATKDGGLNAFNPKSLKFKFFNPVIQGNPVNEKITSVGESIDGTLWFGTSGEGFFSFNSKGEFSSESVNSLKGKTITAFFMSGIHESIVCTEKGLYRYNINSEKMSTVIMTEPITCVIQGSDGLLWFGTEDKGLVSYDIKNNKTVSYPGSKVTSKVTCVLQDRTGMIWAGTLGDGVYKLNPLTGALETYRNDNREVHSLGSNFINSICEDKNGVIWISTESGGLNAFDREKNYFNCYSTQNGLPTNSIGKLMCDDRNNLWIGTDYGICRLTFDTLSVLRQCRIFDFTDGLPTMEFYNGVSTKRNDGEMIFSCKMGWVSFYPDSLINNPYKPPVILTDFQIFNKSILPGDSTGILSSSISVTKEIHLNYWQNVFSFEFTAISFINALKNMYAYKMEGFNNNWIYTDATRRTATYTNLAPGVYIFTVKASNNDGTWNDEGTSIKVFISPPFYKTWLFIFASTLTVLLIIYAIYRNRLSRIRELQDVRNKIASDLHDDIGSGLSSIAVFSELVRQRTGNKAEDIQPFLEKIDTTSRSMSEAIHDIVWTLNPRSDRFDDVLIRMKNFAAQLLSAKNIKLNFVYGDDVISQKLTIEQRKSIYLVFKEAINNIAKYANSELVDVTIALHQKRLKMTIADNGKGFDLQAVQDGNGLVNMRRRAEEIGGSFRIDSAIGKGTVIELEIKTT